MGPALAFRENPKREDQMKNLGQFYSRLTTHTKYLDLTYKKEATHFLMALTTAMTRILT